MDSTACYFVQVVMCLKFCNVTDMRNNIQLQGVPKNHRLVRQVLISEAHNKNSTPQSPFLSVNSVYLYTLYRVS